ncbi:MAG: VWA domain-containing protein [Candidatus Bathyarchaeia archaeon]
MRLWKLRGKSKLLLWLVILWVLTILGCTRHRVKLPHPVRKEVQHAIYEEITVLLPLDVVLVIDQSGSMVRTTDPMGLRMDVAMTYVDFLNSWASEKQNHRLGVVHFGTQAHPERSIPLSDIRSRHDWIKKRLVEQKVEFTREHLGHTMFVSAFREAKRIFEEANAFKPDRRPVILVLTDGRPDNGTGGPLEPYFRDIEGYVNQELLPHGVAIYVIAIDQRNVYWPSNKPYWDRICTPKRTFQIHSAAEAELVYLEITADLLGLEWKEVKTQKVNLPPYLERISFTLLKLSPEVSLRILDPVGREITPKTGGVFYRTDEVGKRYEIYSIPDPEPGTWTVEPVVPSGERFLGKVTVLMHSLFVTVIVHSPKNPHPLKMPMKFEVEFQRRDGKPVHENPKYPLAVYAKVWSPNAKQPQEVSFRREGGVFIGKSDIAADVEGDYIVDLMVKGGGELIFHRQEKVEVKPLPYLKIGDPEVPWHRSIKIQTYLMQAGKRQKVTQVFHPTESAESIGVFRVVRGEERKEILVGYLEPIEEAEGTVLTCVLPPVSTIWETISLIASNLVHFRWKSVFRMKPERVIDQLELRLIGKLASGEEYRSQIFRIPCERVNLFGLVLPWTVTLLILALILRWWFVVGPSRSRPFGELILGGQGGILLGRGRYKRRVLTIGSQGDIRVEGAEPIEGRIIVKKRRRQYGRGWERVCVFQGSRGNPARFSHFFAILSRLGLLTAMVMVVIIETYPWAWIAWMGGVLVALVGGLLGWSIRKMEEMGAFRGESIMTPGWSHTIGGKLIQYR